MKNNLYETIVEGALEKSHDDERDYPNYDERDYPNYEIDYDKEEIEEKIARIISLDMAQEDVKLAVFRDMLNDMSTYCHGNNIKAGWWTDIRTGESLKGKRNVGELLCLVHSEISEAMEGYRKNLQDDKLPHRKMIEVELADAIIRIFDLAGSMDMDLGGAFEEKIQFNKHREDHKIENRSKETGKKF